eukprot:7731900-Pyramimonas_sp.AAC.1
MPHAEQEEEEVEAVYAQIDVQYREACRKGIAVIAAGDFNAEVGPRGDHDYRSVVGENSMPKRNDRGDLLI